MSPVLIFSQRGSLTVIAYPGYDHIVLNLKAVNLIASGAIDALQYLSHFFTLDEINEAFAAAEGRSGLHWLCIHEGGETRYERDDFTVDDVCGFPASGRQCKRTYPA